MKVAEKYHYFSVRYSNRKALLLWLALGSLVLQGCTPPAPENGDVTKLYETDAFKSYWYAGKAEISTYKLDQSRYGEPRDGKAVLIFVTEDFSRDKQVKLDDPSTTDGDKVNVLKMNFTKNFVTGIYPYSMMVSVFTPVVRILDPHTLKVTMSSQEWCGHVFSQMNLTGKKYSFVGHSYFEKEGEQSFSVEASWLEDELWNMIRLDPEGLPIGNVKIIPGLFFTRLKHTAMKPLMASVLKSEEGDQVSYSVSLPEQERELVISYQKVFPHQILGWVETFMDQGQVVHSKAVIDKTILIDYWTKNKNVFRYWRDSLGLSRNNY